MIGGKNMILFYYVFAFIMSIPNPWNLIVNLILWFVAFNVIARLLRNGSHGSMLAHNLLPLAALAVISGLFMLLNSFSLLNTPLWIVFVLAEILLGVWLGLRCIPVSIGGFILWLLMAILFGILLMLIVDTIISLGIIALIIIVLILVRVIYEFF